ncbi:hypothetical protein JTE90_023527 [Oedothorax gibbosus]|uniref:Phosphatidylethanolamine-binding protein n=1 Tax=Oedothorax gibbosus TaxID=931172 RepID=A0AAV6VQ56_9ARAC|nr:hypothetical protein JTE90_023527 [Oedothorax gibbosus]
MSVNDSSEPCIVYKSSKVVPDVVSVGPKLTALIRFDGVVVNMGNELTPTMVKDPPTSVHWPMEDQKLYTLCLTDPDAPSRDEPKLREWLHWLVVNVPHNTEIQSGSILAEYIGAAPPQGTGLHRYVFLVYKQQAKLDCDEIVLLGNSAKGRGNFKIEDFAKKYELGNPLAGNFFYARWDSYVETIQKHLGE